MKNAEFRKLAAKKFPNVRIDPQTDAFGTVLHTSYVDVFIPDAEMQAFVAYCASLGVRAVGIGVGSYTKDYSHRRVCLTS